jgi:hypothetical protein
MGAEVKNQGFDQFIRVINDYKVPRVAVQSRVPKRYGKLLKDFQYAHRLHWRRERMIPDTDNQWRPGYAKPRKADLLIYMLEIGRERFENEIESLLK